MSDPQDRLVYHFTHVENLQSVLEQGYLMCDRVVRRESSLRVECANQGIKQHRRSKKVGLGPGGVVADYVPFYFAPRSPMLYVIHKGSVVTCQDGQDPLVYLVSTPRRLTGAGCRIVFSDGNCAAAITVLEDDLSMLGVHVDWNVMEAERWNATPEDPDRMRRRAAEFLVHECVPLEAFDFLAVRTRQRQEQVRGLLDRYGYGLDVDVRSKWYY